MSFTNTLAASLLDHIFTDPAYSPPATLYIGISTTTPAEDGTNVTEPADTYLRQAVTATDFGAATSADPSVKSNTVAVQFPQATADWLAQAPFTYFVLADAGPAAGAGGAGAILAFGALTVAKPVLNGDTLSFPIGDLDFTLD